jgi:hypothetical protein
MSALLSAQLKFGELFPELLKRMQAIGFGTKIDETGRGFCQAEINALTTAQRTHLAALVIAEFPTLARAVLDLKDGVRGIRSSLHVQRCAGDVVLFHGTVPVWDAEAYRPFGDWWVEQGGDCFWGGNFRSGDGDHFSVSPDGGVTK